MKFLLVGLLSTVLCSCANFMPVEIEGGKALGVMPMQYGHISYQGTHKIAASREDIFRQVRRWVAFNTTRNVYLSPTIKLKVPTPTAAFNVSDNQMTDVISSGTIENIRMRANSTLLYPAVYYTVSIEAYENSYRLTFTNFYTYGFPTPHGLDVRDKLKGYKANKEFYTKVDAEVMKLITELETFVVNEIRTAPIYHEASR